MYTQKISTRLCSNDDNRLIASDKIASYSYGYKGKQALV